MKKLLLLSALLSLSLNATESPKTAPAKTDQSPGSGFKTTPEGEIIHDLTKQLDAAKTQGQLAQAQVGQLQAQQQQQAIIVEYYKTLSERNEAIIRINALTAQLATVQKELDELKAKTAAAAPLEAPAKK